MKWKIEIFGFTICRTKELAELLTNKNNCIKNLRERINQFYYN